MKRKLLLTLICAILLLTGCAQQDKPAMYIEPAQLSVQEEQIKAMAGQGRFVHFFDFQLDQSVQSITVQVYQLEGGQWTPYSAGGKMAMPDQNGKGRLALNFYYLSEGLGVSIQGEKDRYASLQLAPEGASADAANMVLYTTALSAQQEISFDEELPMVLQIHTSRNEVMSISPDFFHQPELIAAEGHDHVYAVTLTFSNEPME